MAARFGESRSREGRPSRADVEEHVLERVEWACSHFFEEQREIPGTGLRVITTDPYPFGPMTFYARLVATGDIEVVEMVSVQDDPDYDFGEG